MTVQMSLAETQRCFATFNIPRFFLSNQQIMDIRNKLNYSDADTVLQFHEVMPITKAEEEVLIQKIADAVGLEVANAFFTCVCDSQGRTFSHCVLDVIPAFDKKGR